MFFDYLLTLLSGQLLQVFFVEEEHDFLNVGVQLSDECIDDALSGVKNVKTANMMEQLAELIMYLPLILILLVLLLDLPLEDLEKLRLQQHLLNGDKDLQNHLKHFTLSELVSNSIGDNNLIIDKLVPVQIDQII